MKLRDKTLLILGGTILFLGILLFYFTQYVFLGSYDRLDQERAYRRLSDVDSVMDVARNTIDGVCRDLAGRISRRNLGNPEDIKSELAGDNTLARELDFVLLVDQKGGSVYSDINEFKSVSSVAKELKQYTVKFIDSKKFDVGESLSGFLSIGGKPCLIGIAPVKVASAGNASYALVGGHLVDEDYLKSIGVVMGRGRAVDIIDISSGIKSFKELYEKNGVFWVANENEDVVIAGRFENDIYGKRSIMYRTRMPRESMIQGRAVLGYFIFFLVLSGILMGVVLFLQLEHNFFAPLIAVGKRMNKIGADGDLSERLDYVGHDEIHGLTKDVDNMLLALESSAKKLSGSEMLFQELFNNIKSGVEIYSIEGDEGELVLEDINSSALRLAGLRKNEVKGMSLLDIYPDMEGSELYEAIMRVSDTGQSVSIEPKKFDSDHMHGWREYQIYKLSSMKLVVVYDDVTPRMVATEELGQKQLELNQSQKMEAIGRLAGGIAHDFNNILTVVNGVSEILLISMEDDDPLRDDIEEINAAGQRAAELTSQLLAFSRRQIMKTRVLDMHEVIDNIRKMLKRLIGEAIELEVVESKESPLVLADSGQMEQVLLNIVLNARDAMPDGGYLEIETSIQKLESRFIAGHVIMEAVKPETGRYVVVKITDTGTGMDQDTLQCICEPFFTTKEEGKGTGLGLSTTYGIIRQSNGFMWFESELGRGTVCTICLPVAEEKMSTSEGKAVRENLPSLHDTVLLVEDEKELRTVIQRFLEHLGCTVLVAASAEDALKLENDYKGEIDIVLSDIIMPGINGLELWDELSQRRSNLKIILITGYDNDDTVREAVNNGMRIITKPFHMLKMVKEIQEVLGHKDSD